MIEIQAEIYLPESKCIRCGYVMDMATAVEDPSIQLPKPGDISLCLKCGLLSIFGEDLRLNPPSPKEILKLRADEKSWMEIIRAAAAIKLLNLTEKGPK